MAEKSVSVAPRAGSGDGWGGSLPLRHDYPEAVKLDLTRLAFAVPTFLVRLRTFIDWHLEKGRAVRVLAPANVEVNHYLARMRIHHDLPAGTFERLLEIQEHDRRNVLIPLTRLHELSEVDVLADDLAPLLGAHLAEVSIPLQPFLLAVSEFVGNGVEHGQSDTGCYVAAQRYTAHKRLSMAIADLGVGVPEHVRQRYPEWIDDAQAIERATGEGVTGTGTQHRGYGFSWVFEELQTNAQIEYAQVTVRSSRGLYRATVRGGEIEQRREARGYKRGTWVGFELGTS